MHKFFCLNLSWGDVWNADSACSHWLSKRPDFNFVFGRCVCQLADKLGQLFQLLWRWGIWMNDWMSPWSVAVVESSGVPTFHRMPWLPCCQEPAPAISGASHPKNVLLCLFSYLSHVWWQIAFRKGHRFEHFWVYLPRKGEEGRLWLSGHFGWLLLILVTSIKCHLLCTSGVLKVAGSAL